MAGVSGKARERQAAGRRHPDRLGTAQQVFRSILPLMLVLLDACKQVLLMANFSKKRHVDEDHLTVLCAKRNVEPQALTIQGYLREVARLSSFLARTHDGDPGWQTLWRRLTLLDAWVNGYQRAKKCG
jgi:hypothetical protein